MTDALDPAPGKTHELKTWPGPFQDVLDGIKTHEIRVNDRDYQAGDRLHLHEYVPDGSLYTGRDVTVDVTFVTPGGNWGLPANLCVMSIHRAYKEAEAAALPGRLAGALNRARPKLELYERVHVELDEGKDWEDIDNGFRPDEPRRYYEIWLAGMQQALINSLSDIILSADNPAAALSMPGWRDIATAPKDGTPILAYAVLGIIGLAVIWAMPFSKAINAGLTVIALLCYAVIAFFMWRLIEVSYG